MIKTLLFCICLVLATSASASVQPLKIKAETVAVTGCPPKSYLAWVYMVAQFYVGFYFAQQTMYTHYPVCWDRFVKDVFMVPHTISEFNEMFPEGVEMPDEQITPVDDVPEDCGCEIQ